MGSTITFADFFFEGGENVEIVEISNSKSDFLSRIGLQESCRQNTFLFRAMMVRATLVRPGLPHARTDLCRTKQELDGIDYSVAGHVSCPKPQPTYLYKPLTCLSTFQKSLSPTSFGPSFITPQPRHEEYIARSGHHFLSLICGSYDGLWRERSKGRMTTRANQDASEGYTFRRPKGTLRIAHRLRLFQDQLQPAEPPCRLPRRQCNIS
jgi:hypothetical protein